MGKCIVKNCTNYYGKKTLDKTIRFFRFPKDPKLLSEWLKVCEKVENYQEKNHSVCSEHFEDSEYLLQDILLNEPVSRRRLKPGAVPTKKIFHSESSPERIMKEEKVRHRILVDQALKSYEDSNEHDISLLLSKLMEIQGTSHMAITTDGERTAEEAEAPQPVIEMQESSEMNVSRKNAMVQTEVETACSQEYLIASLQAKLRKLLSISKKQAKEINRANTQLRSLRKVFTPGQLRRLGDPKKKFRWEREDICSAISLYSAGPRSYRLLRRRGYPLPGPSTLGKWAVKFKKNYANN